jgi:fucose permease
MAIPLCLTNVFVANLTNATTLLGFAHGSYGLGGTVGPLIATAMASHGIRWSNFYFIALGFAAVNGVFSSWSYWNYETDTPPAIHLTQSGNVQQEARLQKVKESLKNKTTILMSLFIFLYQGAEVSISGWVISFLINVRKGDPTKVGYVTAGFWAGITIGRLLLTPLAAKWGERWFVVVMVALAAAFEGLTWGIPNIVGDAGKSRLYNL